MMGAMTLTLMKGDMYQACPVSAAMGRTAGGRWAMRSGVLREFIGGWKVREVQLGEEAWGHVERRALRPGLTLSILPQRPNLPIEALRRA